MHRLVLLALLPVALSYGPTKPSAQSPAPVQLLITNARVLDVRTGRVTPRQAVVIDGGLIREVISDSAARRRGVAAHDTLDARDRLLTPGLVDAHSHSGMILVDSITPTGGYIAHLVDRPDSIRAYRQRVASAYLPHGVTLVADLASPVRDMLLLQPWKGRPDFPDLLPSGAALVSPEEGRVIPPFQVAVRNEALAAGQVRAFASLGIRNVKLYWRLRKGPLRAAVREAERLGLNASAHVDFGLVTIDTALALGVRHFEHVHTIAASLLTSTESDTVVTRTAAHLGVKPAEASSTPGAGVVYTHEEWNLLGRNEPRVLALIDRLRDTGSTLTPTVHLLAQRLGIATSVTPPSGRYEDVSRFTVAQTNRAIEGYRILMEYVARMDSIGVRLAVGSDTPEPGRGVLDEIIQLHVAGIAPWRVFRIATLYSAEAIGTGEDYGTTEAGRRANLVLFDANPLQDIKAVLGGKTVIKDGVIVHR